MRPTNALWYLAAFATVLGSWMASAVVAAGAWTSVEEASLSTELDQVETGQMSVAVYALDPADDVTCTATDPSGAEHEVREASLDLTVEHEGRTWTFVGLHYDAEPVVSIACTPAEGSYGVAVVDGFERGSTAIGVAVVGTLLGIGLAFWTWWARRSRRRDGPAD